MFLKQKFDLSEGEQTTIKLFKKKKINFLCHVEIIIFLNGIVRFLLHNMIPLD